MLLDGHASKRNASNRKNSTAELQKCYLPTWYSLTGRAKRKTDSRLLILPCMVRQVKAIKAWGSICWAACRAPSMRVAERQRACGRRVGQVQTGSESGPLILSFYKWESQEARGMLLDAAGGTALSGRASRVGLRRGSRGGTPPQVSRRRCARLTQAARLLTMQHSTRHMRTVCHTARLAAESAANSIPCTRA